MADTNLNVRTEKEVKEAAEKLFAELGMNMTTAINIFLRQAIRENGIPFDLKLNIPNKITIAAIDEGQKLIANGKSFASMEDLKAELEA